MSGKWPEDLWQSYKLTHDVYEEYLYKSRDKVVARKRNLKFVADNQDKLQGKYDAMVEFGSTPGGVCAYQKYLYQVPVAVTINYSTANLEYLETHGWLKNSGNRVLVTFPIAPP